MSAQHYKFSKIRIFSCDVKNGRHVREDEPSGEFVLYATPFDDDRQGVLHPVFHKGPELSGIYESSEKTFVPYLFLKSSVDIKLELCKII